jgi:hypothetical protein
METRNEEIKEISKDRQHLFTVPPLAWRQTAVVHPSTAEAAPVPFLRLTSPAYSKVAKGDNV